MINQFEIKTSPNLMTLNWNNYRLMTTCLLQDACQSFLWCSLRLLLTTPIYNGKTSADKAGLMQEKLVKDSKRIEHASKRRPFAKNSTCSACKPRMNCVNGQLQVGFLCAISSCSCFVWQKRYQCLEPWSLLLLSCSTESLMVWGLAKPPKKLAYAGNWGQSAVCATRDVPTKSQLGDLKSQRFWTITKQGCETSKHRMTKTNRQQTYSKKVAKDQRHKKVHT